MSFETKRNSAVSVYMYIYIYILPIGIILIYLFHCFLMCVYIYNILTLSYTNLLYVQRLGIIKPGKVLRKVYILLFICVLNSIIPAMQNIVCKYSS